MSNGPFYDAGFCHVAELVPGGYRVEDNDGGFVGVFKTLADAEGAIRDRASWVQVKNTMLSYGPDGNLIRACDRTKMPPVFVHGDVAQEVRDAVAAGQAD